MSLLRSVSALLAVMFLASCATVPAIQNPVSSTTLTHFEVRGGFGVWTDSQNISARMSWQQRGPDFTFDLNAPLGMGSLQLKQANGRSTVVRGDKVVASDAEPGVALQQALVLAQPVPVAQIAQWLKGQPGNAESFQYNSEGLLKSLSYTDQSGVKWYAVIRKRQQFQNAYVPALITAKGGDYNVRIVLKEWLPLSPKSAEPTPAKKPSQRLSIPAE